jgi:hypothetical protein
MNAKELRREFATAAVATDPTFVYDERTALDLIARAQEEDVAIARIEMVRAEDLGRMEPPERRVLRDADRRASWRTAQSHVEMLAGRGLYFEVSLESAWSTTVARTRSFLRKLVFDGTSARLPPSRMER